MSWPIRENSTVLQAYNPIAHSNILCCIERHNANGVSSMTYTRDKACTSLAAVCTSRAPLRASASAATQHSSGTITTTTTTPRPSVVGRHNETPTQPIKATLVTN